MPVVRNQDRAGSCDCSSGMAGRCGMAVISAARRAGLDGKISGTADALATAGTTGNG